MSDNKPHIPRKDDDKNGYYLVVVPYINLTANQARFNTPTAILGTLNTNYALWGPNWLKLKDATQRTKTVIDLKDSLELLIDDSLDEIYGDIADSVLTANDKAVFLIFDRKNPSNAVVSPIPPDMEQDSSGHLWSKFLFHNTATPSSKKAPTGNFIFFETCIGAAGIAPADVVFANGNVCTTASQTFHFTEDQVGQTCYVHSFYQTKKGDRSPASAIISFVIM